MNKFTAYHADLRLTLRKVGNSKSSIVVDTDEGDGIEFYFKEDTISKKHYEEWINQLEIVLSKLKELNEY